MCLRGPACRRLVSPRVTDSLHVPDGEPPGQEIKSRPRTSTNQRFGTLDRSYPYVLQILHATPGNRAEQTPEPAKLLLNKGYPIPTGLDCHSASPMRMGLAQRSRSQDLTKSPLRACLSTTETSGLRRCHEEEPWRTYRPRGSRACRRRASERSPSTATSGYSKPSPPNTSPCRRLGRQRSWRATAARRCS